MSYLTPNIFYWGRLYPVGATSSAADPQLQFFENFQGHFINNYGGAASNGTLSVHAVNIPLSISLNHVIFYRAYGQAAAQTRTESFYFGLYSMNAGTLSLANSASGNTVINPSQTVSIWINLTDISATQNITPGTWYFGFVNAVAGAGGISWGINSSINPANAILAGFVMGRMTASTGAMPSSIGTSTLDITGSDAIRQQYIIITA